LSLCAAAAGLRLSPALSLYGVLSVYAMAAGNPVTVAERTQKHTSSVKSVPQHGCATFKATFGYSVGDFGFMKSPCSRAIREGSLHQVAASRSCAGCSAGRPDSFSVRPVGEVALPTAGQRSVVRPPASGSARERPDSGGREPATNRRMNLTDSRFIFWVLRLAGGGESASGR